MIPFNWIQYRGTVGMFNNRHLACSSLNYSNLSKKHNYDTFVLAVGLIILTFWHLINVLSNWKFISRFLSDLVVGICNFSRKILYLSMIGVYVHHIWLCLSIIRLSGDIEENPVKAVKNGKSCNPGILQHSVTLY